MATTIRPETAKRLEEIARIVSATENLELPSDAGVECLGVTRNTVAQDTKFEFVKINVEPDSDREDPAQLTCQNVSLSDTVVGLCPVKYEVDNDKFAHNSEPYFSKYIPGITTLELKPLDIKSEPFPEDTFVSSEPIGSGLEELDYNVDAPLKSTEDKNVTSESFTRLLVSNQESRVPSSDLLQSSSAETPAVLPEHALPPGSSPFRAAILCGPKCPVPFGKYPHLPDHTYSMENSTAVSGTRQATLGRAGEDSPHREQRGYRFKRKQTLVPKLLIDIGDRPPNCTKYGYSCHQGSSLNLHNYRKHLDDLLKCDFCTFKTANKSYLKDHISAHLGCKLHRCDRCDYKTSWSGNLTTHKRKHTNKIFKCDQCDYSTSRRAHLTDHKRVHTGALAFQCAVCKSNCSWRRTICEHTSYKRYRCKVCDFESSRRVALSTHMRTHTKYSFKCQHCDFTTEAKCHLLTHMSIHMRRKQYSCDACGFKSAYRSSLLAHDRTHTGKQLYPCDFCDFSTSNRSHLRSHISTHPAVKPSRCDICQYSCSRKSILSYHMRIHSGHFFECDRCSYKAITRYHLKRHARLHDNATEK